MWGGVERGKDEVEGESKVRHKTKKRMERRGSWGMKEEVGVY